MQIVKNTNDIASHLTVLETGNELWPHFVVLKIAYIMEITLISEGAIHMLVIRFDIAREKYTRHSI